jgi:predicted esterase
VIPIFSVGSLLVSTWGALAVGTGASSEESSTPAYFAEGDALFRSRGSSVEVSRAGQGGPWTEIDGIPSHWGAVSRVVCAADDTRLCVIGFRSDRDLAPRWGVVRLDAAGANLAPFDAVNGGTVHDVTSFGGGEVLFTRAGSEEGQLLRASLSADEAVQALPIDAFNNQPGIARYLTRRDGSKEILALEAGSPVRWVLAGLDGERRGQTIATSRFFALSGRNIVSPVAPTAATSNLPSGSLVLTSVPETADGAWRNGRAFASPSYRVVNRDWEDPAEASVVSFRGGLLAAFSTPSDVALGEVCGRPGATSILPLSRSLEGAADVSLDSGRSFAIARVVNLWGDSSQHLVVFPEIASSAPLRACNSSPLSLTELVAAPVRPELETQSFSIVPDQQGSPAYVVIGLPGASGRVMIRPYGAFGLPVQRHALGALERRWLERGGRLIVPTLSGDDQMVGDPRSSRGDYKAGATADLIAVVEDAVTRGIGESGTYVLSGSSAGGFVAAKAALTRPDLFDSVLIFAGALDLSLLSNTRTDVEEFGDPGGTFQDWYGGVAAPRNAPEFLLWFAADDPRVPSDTGRRFAGYLRTLGYTGELTIGDRGGHTVGLREDTAGPALAFIDRVASQ